MRTCHEQEVRRLTEQLHESVQIGSKRLLETERLVDSKEKQLARWREEALGVGSLTWPEGFAIGLLIEGIPNEVNNHTGSCQIIP